MAKKDKRLIPESEVKKAPKKIQNVLRSFIIKNPTKTDIKHAKQLAKNFQIQE